MRIRHLACMAILVAFDFILHARTVMADEVLKNRFLKEYPAASRRIEERLSKIRGKYQFRSNAAKSENEFFNDHGKEKLHTTVFLTSIKTESIPETIQLFGKDFYYNLTRRHNNEPYQLKSIGSLKRDGLQYENYDGLPMKVALGRRPSLISKLLASEYFELIDVTETGLKAGQVKVTFLSGNATPKNETSAILDTQNSWSVISLETVNKAKNNVLFRMNVEYGQVIDGLAMPKLVQIERDGRPEAPITFSEWQFTGTPEEEFTIKHYGMPDIKPNRQSNQSRFYFWLVPAVTLAILALVIVTIKTKVSKPLLDTK